MNSMIRTLLVCLLALGGLAAQAQERRFAVLDYMHIPEGGTEQSYLAIEKLWQRLHQKAVDSGRCLSWYLERVENGGRAHFVTIRIYDSLAKIADPWPESMVQGLYSEEEGKTMNRTQSVRDLIRSELWEIDASALPGEGGDPSSYVYIHFMKAKPGKGAEYYNLEKDTYVKIHQARIKAGEMKNWHFLSRMFPSGTDEAYDFATINVYAAKDPSWNHAMVEKALGKEAAAKLADPLTLRTMVREEIWRPVLATKPAKK